MKTNVSKLYFPPGTLCPMLTNSGTLCPGTLCPGTFWPGFGPFALARHLGGVSCDVVLVFLRCFNRFTHPKANPPTHYLPLLTITPKSKNNMALLKTKERFNYLPKWSDCSCDAQYTNTGSDWIEIMGIKCTIYQRVFLSPEKDASSLDGTWSGKGID